METHELTNSTYNYNAVTHNSQLLKEWMHAFDDGGKLLEPILKKFNLSDVQDIKRLSLKDMHQDDRFLRFLQTFCDLGNGAKADCDQMRKMRMGKVEDTENDVSDAEATLPLISEDNSHTVCTENDTFVDHLHTLEELHSKFKDSLQQDANLSTLEDTMNDLKRHEALVYAELEVKRSDLTQLKEKIHCIFKNCWELIELSPSLEVLPKLREKIIEYGWTVESQKPCVLLKKNCNIVDVSLRIYGRDCTMSNVKNVIATYEQNDKAEEKCKCEFTENIICDSMGSLVKFKVTLADLKKGVKRNAKKEFCHLRRILFTIKFDFGTYKCWTHPFAVMTGTAQQWPYTGAVQWYIWANKKPGEINFRSPSNLSVEELSAMFFSQLKVKGLQKCFTERNKDTYKEMLTSLCKGANEIEINSFIQSKMPKQKRRKKENDFSMYSWCVAAMNSFIYFEFELKDLLKHGIIWSISSFEEVKNLLSSQEPGTAVIRISQNHISSKVSKKPYASLCVHVNASFSGKELYSFDKNADEVKDIYTYLNSLRSNAGEPLVKTILLNTTQLCCVPLSVLKRNIQVEDTRKTNRYRTCYIEQTVVLGVEEKMKSMDLNVEVKESVEDSGIPRKVAKMQEETSKHLNGNSVKELNLDIKCSHQDGMVNMHSGIGKLESQQSFDRDMDTQPSFNGDTQQHFGGDTQQHFGGETQQSFGGDTQQHFGGDTQQHFGGW
ncbi:uncharacterized protein LOC131943998 [Physella acuta]|uniref:uncharacterized protein LOC131943998 n=1 Tax=Physella acuta TaxID=109671 RepID=UPI0027DE99BE|nr:uncharacterized protein LOC131943998 [Physella acuta]